MANETTYSDISSLIPDVWEAAMFYAQQNFFMPNLVTVFSDQMGMQARKGTTYSAGTVATSISEKTDLNDERQAFSRSAEYTLTPAEIGTQYLVTDRRMATDDVMNIVADLTQHIGYSVFEQVESDLLTNMASFTGGTIGSAGGTLTWANVYDAAAVLRAAGVPAPYYCVLHEYQYRRLAQQANIAGLSNAAPLMIRDGIQSNYLVQNIGGGIFLYTTGVLTAGTAVSGGMFAKRAMGYDIRRGLFIGVERDESLRATEFNATHWYAEGLIRAGYGVTLLGDASAPS